MSDVAQGAGWWQASDGKWYPPTAMPASTPPPPVGASAPLPGPAVPLALSVVLQVAFGFTAALETLLLVLMVRARSTFADYWNNPFDDDSLWSAAVDAEDRYVSASNVALVANVGLFILLVVWMWRCHSATDRLRPGDRKWSRGWTVGGWFIPIANLVIPKRVMNEIERLAIAPRNGGAVDRGWRSVRESAVGWLWWLAFVASWLGVRWADNMADDAAANFDGDALISAYGLGIGATAVGVAAAICGAIYVGRLSRRLSPAAFSATYVEQSSSR